MTRTTQEFIIALDREASLARVMLKELEAGRTVRYEYWKRMEDYKQKTNAAQLAVKAQREYFMLMDQHPIESM